jgi:biopolymer transport protein ExbB
MNHRATRRLAAFATIAAAVLAPALARAWWNEEWTARKPIRIDTGATGSPISEPIGAAPVLVRLHAGNFKFEQAKEDGSDLRFVAGDDKTPLKHHVEKYDALLGEALVWVGVPDVKPGTKNEIWLYYRNPKAVAAEDARGTYDPATVLVFHFAEKGQPPRDSTTWGNQASTAGTSADGAIIGRGLKLDGTGAVTIPAGPSLAWLDGSRITWSAWVRPAEGEANGVVFARRDGANAFVVGFEEGKPYVEIDRGKGAQRSVSATPLAGNGWHHLAVTVADATSLLVDGTTVANLGAELPALNNGAIIGGTQPPPPADAAPAGRKGAQKEAPPPAGFKGDLDELQISKVARPTGFIQLAAISQGTDPGKLIVAGQEEETGGSGGGYFSILIKSVTLDGWIVIGVLAVMLVVSWMVMIGKASFLSAVERANAQFLERFHRESADLAGLVDTGDGGALGDPKALEASPLYKMYGICAEEVRKRTGTGKPLRAESIEAIRASLDAGQVRENQRLSKNLVLLTIAISGGPFLGLLGTVVGVMITFAAIAAAGDVNVNAIAPGIAAALVATVAGLAVAIPALFGYNWLLSRVKNISATLQVFVDELITKVAEAYAERGTRDESDERNERPSRPTIVAAEGHP